MLIDWSKLLQAPYHYHHHYHHQTIQISAWQGTYTNYVRYMCNSSGRARRADLIVAYQPDFAHLPPHKLRTNWSDALNTILSLRVPCLLTFATGEEKQRAAQALATSFHANFLAVQPNEFSSLLLRQLANKPNQVYALNGFAIVMRGFSNTSAPTSPTTTTVQCIDPVTRYIKLNSNGNCCTTSPNNDYLFGN